MTRRSRKNPFAGMPDSVQLQGFVAKFDTICKRCGEPILKAQTRVIRHGDGLMHVTCASGWEDE